MPLTSILKCGAASAVLLLSVTVAPAAVTDVPKRYSGADEAFFAYVLKPETFCNIVGQPYVTRGLGCGGTIVHDHTTEPASPAAFLGDDGKNYISVPDIWWEKVVNGQIRASFLQIVMAHEEGHLVCGHELGQPTLANEYIADRFAGAAMHRVWGDGHIAREVIIEMIDEAYAGLLPDAIHPGAKERTYAFVWGYLHPETAKCTL